VVATTSECHTEVLEVPQDGSEGSEEFNTKDEVELAQTNAEAADGELLGTNGKGDVASNPLALNIVDVGHQHPQRGV
jgi:hypothetical protein